MLTNIFSGTKTEVKMNVINMIMAVVAPLLLAVGPKDDAKAETNRELDIHTILSIVNEYRTTGADCGNVYHPPVDPVKCNTL